VPLALWIWNRNGVACPAGNAAVLGANVNPEAEAVNPSPESMSASMPGMPCRLAEVEAGVEP